MDSSRGNPLEVGMRSSSVLVTFACVVLAGFAVSCSTSDRQDTNSSADSQVQTSSSPRVTPSERMTYYVGIIRKGTSWSADDSEESRATQTAHLDNIRRLADLKLLALAGPFYKPDEQLETRGLFFYTVPSMDSAKQLVRTDPAVKSGQLTVDLLRWRAPASMGYPEPLQMRAYVAAFIHPGENWLEGQDWSYANLMATQHSGVARSNSVRGIPIYGPFVSSATDGQPLAMLIYDTDSLQYVAPLLDATADIAAATLSYETMYWYGPVGLTF